MSPCAEGKNTILAGEPLKSAVGPCASGVTSSRCACWCVRGGQRLRCFSAGSCQNATGCSFLMQLGIFWSGVIGRIVLGDKWRCEAPPPHPRTMT